MSDAVDDADVSELLFVPLGGTGEIGMNLNLYCYDGVWVMVDCGMMISSVDGADQIFAPDPTFLIDKDISALILTHAHEDLPLPHLRHPLHGGGGPPKDR